MNQTKEGLSEVLKENWHAIEGANGMCACGTEKGNCNTRLLEALQEAEQRVARGCLDIIAMIYPINDDEAPIVDLISEKIKHQYNI